MFPKLQLYLSFTKPNNIINEIEDKFENSLIIRFKLKIKKTLYVIMNLNIKYHISLRLEIW